MTSLLTDEDALAVARILYGIRQRRAARLAAEQAMSDQNPSAARVPLPVGDEGFPGEPPRGRAGGDTHG